MTDSLVNPNLSLPPGFQFSQSALQDFKDCPRRFYLKYILNQQWPAPLAEPQAEFELAMQRGERLHRMIERHQLGVPMETIRANVTDPVIQEWITQYQTILSRMEDFESVWPEVRLSTMIHEYPLIAKFDLVALKEHHLTAIDWKTGKLPPTRFLSQRLQTQVYSYILYHQAKGRFDPRLETITFNYISIPHNDIRTFRVDGPNITEYEENIYTFITDILSSEFDKVEDERPCRFCVYRSLCERGTTPVTDIQDLEDNMWESPELEDDDLFSVEF